jgi:colanic acid biosynthesis glycosyl transferase WcaI
MKILVQGINFAPELIGIAKYTTEMCAALAARGHDIHVITAPPYYPNWAVPAPYRATRYQNETIETIPVTRCPLYVPRTPTGTRRLIHHASFAASSALATLYYARRLRPDVVFAVAPSLMSAPAAYLAARVCGAVSWLHLQDFEIDAAFDLGFLSGQAIRRLALAGERRLLGAFDCVSSISPKMIAHLRRKGVDDGRLFELRNWVDTTFIKPSDRLTSYRLALGIDAATIVALYSGNMSAKQGLEHLAQAARWLAANCPEVVVILCGAGPMRPRLEALTAGVANVHFIDLQPNAKMSELLATADIHLLPQRAEAADLVLPSKLAGMLASGRPIVAMADAGSGLAAAIIGAGVAVPTGPGDALAHAIACLAGNADQRNRYGKEARRVALAAWDMSPIIAALELQLERTRSCSYWGGNGLERTRAR